MTNDHKVPEDVRNCVLRKYNNTCQECGRRLSDTSQLHVHHKSYDPEDEKRLENYELLCTKCHMKRHDLVDLSKPKSLIDPKIFEVGRKIKREEGG